MVKWSRGGTGASIGDKLCFVEEVGLKPGKYSTSEGKFEKLSG